MLKFNHLFLLVFVFFSFLIWIDLIYAPNFFQIFIAIYAAIGIYNLSTSDLIRVDQSIKFAFLVFLATLLQLAPYFIPPIEHGDSRYGKYGAGSEFDQKYLPDQLYSGAIYLSFQSDLPTHSNGHFDEYNAFASLTRPDLPPDRYVRNNEGEFLEWEDFVDSESKFLIENEVVSSLSSIQDTIIMENRTVSHPLTKVTFLYNLGTQGPLNIFTLNIIPNGLFIGGVYTEYLFYQDVDNNYYTTYEDSLISNNLVNLRQYGKILFYDKEIKPVCPYYAIPLLDDLIEKGYEIKVIGGKDSNPSEHIYGDKLSAIYSNYDFDYISDISNLDEILRDYCPSIFVSLFSLVGFEKKSYKFCKREIHYLP